MKNPPKRGRIAQAAAGRSRIVRAAIFPSIGIARIGNSAEKFFIGPEVADPRPQSHAYYRDKKDGSLKRQAARFRVYGLDARGRAVAELQLPDARIEWTVHLANKKAEWFQSHMALDVPEAANGPAVLRRNAAVANRADLIIDPGPRSITGPNAGGQPAHIFDSGCFMGQPVYLGELQTETTGRLLVLGGRGVSKSAAGMPVTGVPNNETWHDDTSDGPVTAKVWYKGKPLRVDPAWVVVAPPNYAPQQKSVCTMWDLIRDVAIRATTKAHPLPKIPVKPSFNRDIRPIFERLSNLQWVNAGYATGFGWGGPNYFASPAMLTRLSSKRTAEVAFRQTIANQFRDPRSSPQGDPTAAATPQLWPWQFGDVYKPATPSPRQYSSLTATQLQMLKVNWVQGMFTDDYNPKARPLWDLAKLPVREQPEMLTRAALEFCVADAFHPGVEMTWNMRSAAMYVPGDPFRVQHARPNSVEPELGLAFYRSELFKDIGPLGPQRPGGLTRWMAVPWQADTAGCRVGRSGDYDPYGYTPTWWPARVPNQVLTPANYRKVKNRKLSLATRLAAFFERTDWVAQGAAVLGNVSPRQTSGSGVAKAMVKDFGRMGVVAEVAGPGIPQLPARMQVSDRKPR